MKNKMLIVFRNFPEFQTTKNLCIRARGTAGVGTRSESTFGRKYHAGIRSTSFTGSFMELILPEHINLYKAIEMSRKVARVETNTTDSMSGSDYYRTTNFIRWGIWDRPTECVFGSSGTIYLSDLNKFFSPSDLFINLFQLGRNKCPTCCSSLDHPNPEFLHTEPVITNGYYSSRFLYNYSNI
jgi:hypothetical protein